MYLDSYLSILIDLGLYSIKFVFYKGDYYEFRNYMIEGKREIGEG